jgi:hypothetical protein
VLRRTSSRQAVIAPGRGQKCGRRGSWAPLEACTAPWSGVEGGRVCLTVRRLSTFSSERLEAVILAVEEEADALWCAEHKEEA